MPLSARTSRIPVEWPRFFVARPPATRTRSSTTPCEMPPGKASASCRRSLTSLTASVRSAVTSKSPPPSSGPASWSRPTDSSSRSCSRIPCSENAHFLAFFVTCAPAGGGGDGGLGGVVVSRWKPTPCPSRRLVTSWRRVSARRSRSTVTRSNVSVQVPSSSRRSRRKPARCTRVGQTAHAARQLTCLLRPSIRAGITPKLRTACRTSSKASAPAASPTTSVRSRRLSVVGGSIGGIGPKGGRRAPPLRARAGACLAGRARGASRTARPSGGRPVAAPAPSLTRRFARCSSPAPARPLRLFGTACVLRAMPGSPASRLAPHPPALPASSSSVRSTVSSGSSSAPATTGTPAAGSASRPKTRGSRPSFEGAGRGEHAFASAFVERGPPRSDRRWVWPSPQALPRGR